MQVLELYGCMKIPENSSEILNEPILNKHERYLRIMLIYKHPPIYIGDSVAVSHRWNNKESKNIHAGKKGTVINIEPFARFSHDAAYLIYHLKDDKGGHFQTFYYTLDLVRQAEGNMLLEKILTETNETFLKFLKDIHGDKI